MVCTPQKSSGETILSSFRRLREKFFPWNSKRRMVYEWFRKQIIRFLKNLEWKTPSRKLKSPKLYKYHPERYNLSPKPSIAFVIPSQNISGGIMVVCQHANMLIKKGFDIVLIDDSPDDPYVLDWYPDLLPEVISVNEVAHRIDIVIATGWSTAYTVNDFPAKRKLYFIQSDETRFSPAGAEEVELARRTYALDFEFVVIAKWLQKWLKEEFGKSAHYVPNGVDTTLFYPDKPLVAKKEKLRILLEGSIEVPFKGMKEAFQVVDGMDCEVWCVSSAGHPESNWKCDRFFGRVPLEKMRQIYSSCDVLIKMSTVEGFFMPPLEMMACGGTVIVNKVTGYDEYIVDGYNGLVVEQGDVGAAREKVTQLIKDRALLQKLIMGGQETVKRYTWEESNGLLERVIKHENNFSNPDTF